MIAEGAFLGRSADPRFDPGDMGDAEGTRKHRVTVDDGGRDRAVLANGLLERILLAEAAPQPRPKGSMGNSLDQESTGLPAASAMVR